MLRISRLDDAEAFLALRGDRAVQHLLMANPDAEPPSDVLGDAKAWIARREAAGWFRVADEGDGALGFVQIAEIHRKNRYGWFGMALLPKARGRGLGSRLLAASATAALTELGLRKLLVQIRADNVPVVDLHVRQGWSIAGQLRAHYDDGTSFHDVMILEKILQ
ncbi:MAG: GNAT family N-acetyltransferase [Paracoccaceae bacterium]